MGPRPSWHPHPIRSGDVARCAAFLQHLRTARTCSPRRGGAAGIEAFRSVVPRCLGAGIDVVAVSAAAMAEAVVEAEISQSAARGGGRLFFASGAVAALDALSAAREDGLEYVKVIQRKTRPRTAGRG
ncbi:hypothetical protein [Ancylobacter terrae]|uniref:hypothetical protein n=1 Tax=Ancylobacter sp. sgz301288 TaxID=3342077 RepID=UPI00385DD9EE